MLVDVSFGEWLKRRRLGLGLTQDQLALQINCSTSALRKFESEERRPSAETIEQLAIIFDIPPEERKAFLRFARGDWQAFPGFDADNAPWRSAMIDRQSNLPSLYTSFIGRQVEQQEVIDHLKKNRLVTLAGAGGIGKTRLAVQVGHLLLEDFPHGVWFVPLDSLSDPLRVPQTVAAVFGIQEGVDRQVIDTLKSILRLKTALLILDNCEHLLDACAQLVNTLLIHCPDLRILTTSREILKLDGEATYYLTSLSTPEQSDSLEKISAHESIQLFVERAGLALSTFRLTKENAHTVAEICRRVDGIPLAIELIAARLNILTVDEISEQLKNSFAILASKNRTTLSRHQTLQASIDWSWSLLTDAEKAFLRQLSVFFGGWTLEAVQSVCDGDALSLISSLVQKSLIMVDREPEHETRYHFHETLRHYADEKLNESGELETIRVRHLRYYLGLSEKIKSGLLGSKQEQWFARTVDERENLHAALGQAAKSDIEAGLLISARLEAVWEEYDVRNGECWLDEFLKNPVSNQYPLARARALCAQGRLYFWLERLPQAQRAAEESLSLFKAHHDQIGETDALTILGATCYFLGNHAEAVKLLKGALALAQSLADIWRQAKAYYFLGWDHSDYQRSFAYWEKALVLFGKAGDQRFQALLLCQIALVRVKCNDIELAEKYLDKATRLFSINRQIEGRGYFQITKSIIALEHGDYEQAHILLKEALAYSEKSGNRSDYLWAQAQIGYLALREGDFREARAVFSETAKEFHKIQETIAVVFTLEGMAGLFAATGDYKNAARLIGWGNATRKEINNLRPPLEKRDVDMVIEACLSRMGEIAFADAYDDGRGMTADEAVALALNEG